jgi:hypothetical protein
VQTIALHGQVQRLTVHGLPVYWHQLHRLFVRQPEHPVYLEPHVSKEDLEWTALEATLSGLDTRLSFWIGTHGLAFVSNEQVVSLNLLDVCFNALFKLPIVSTTKKFVAETVGDELYLRYLQEPTFSSLIERHMDQYDDDKQEFLL